MPDAWFCGDLEPHLPHKYTRTGNLFALADCKGRPEPDAGKDDWPVEADKPNSRPWLHNRAYRLIYKNWPPEAKPKLNEFRWRLDALLKEYEDDPDINRKH